MSSRFIDEFELLCNKFGDDIVMPNLAGTTRSGIRHLIAAYDACVAELKEKI
jgi:hypothetical protein